MRSVKLTAKQKNFVAEYIIDFNATRAAKAAGYSEKTANRIASQNLTKTGIQKAIAKAMKERNERVKINADYVLLKAKELLLKSIGEVAVDKVFVSNGEPVLFTAREFNASGAGKALEILGKHVDIQAFKEKVEHSGEMTINNLIAEISANNAKKNTSPLPKDNK